MKVGLFFGSFNPIHTGHLMVGNYIVETTDLDELWFVVSPRNPFKSAKSLLHEFDRIDMVEQAIKDNQNFRASDIEFHLPKPSYTITTLTHLADKFTHDFVLILGEDNLQSFSNWRNHKQILQNHKIFIYPRPGVKPGQNVEAHSEITSHPNIKKIDEAPIIGISATMIRKFVRENRSIRYLVPDKVAQTIYDKKYYN
ncbi:MAG: nicotinate (nicotinamide) nucleotide adenylyltransferase [Cyclobacteriaceae bacterium]